MGWLACWSAAVRVSQAHLAEGLSPEQSAGLVSSQRQQLEGLVARLQRRMRDAAQDEAVDERVAQQLINRLDRWQERQSYAVARSQTLSYERTGNTGRHLPLLTSPENASAQAGLDAEVAFVVANSMREVQPEINVRVSPITERLFLSAPPGAPKWTLPVEADES